MNTPPLAQSNYSSFYLKKKIAKSTKSKLDHLGFDRVSFELNNANETIGQLKSELKSKAKEIALLKVSHMKKEKEMRTYTKSISEIIRYSDLPSIQGMSAISHSIESNSKLPTLTEPIHLTSSQKKRMSEMVQISALKSKLQERATVVENQTKEIQELKESQTLSTKRQYGYIENNNEIKSNKERIKQLQRDNEDLNYFLKIQIKKLKNKDEFCKIFHQMKEKIKKNTGNAKSRNCDYSRTTTDNKWITNQTEEDLPIEESFKIAETKIQQMQKKIYDLTTVIEDHKRTINDFREENANLIKTNSDLRSNISILKRNKKELLNKIALASNSNGNKGCIINMNESDNKKLDELQSKNEEMESQLSKMIEINKELHIYISETERMYYVEKAKVEEYEKEMIECNNMKEKLNEEMKNNEHLNMKIKELNVELGEMYKNKTDEIKEEERKEKLTDNSKDLKEKETNQPLVSESKSKDDNKELLSNKKQSEDFSSILGKDNDKDNDEIEQEEQVNYISSSADM